MDAAEIRIKLLSHKNHDVNRLIEDGKKLVAETNRPNVITLAQFTPFLPLFQMSEEDQKRYQADRPNGPYAQAMEALYKRYILELGINKHQRTVVIQSLENPVELVVLPRLFTRIQPDKVAGESARKRIPGNISKAASVTRDQMMLDAGLIDLMTANQSPEQNRYFALGKMEQAIIQKAFVERNMSPEAKAKLLKESGITSTDTPKHNTSTDVTLFDDDD